MKTYSTYKYVHKISIISVLCFVFFFNLNASNIEQSPQKITNTVEFKKFHDLSKFIDCFLTIQGTNDPWLVGINDNKISKLYNNNSIKWSFEDLSFAFFYNSKYYICSHSIGVSAETIIYDIKNQKISVYTFGVENMKSNTMLNVIKTGIDDNGRFFQNGTFNLLNKTPEWGTKSY